jgi:hypothetical protein
LVELAERRDRRSIGVTGGNFGTLLRVVAAAGAVAAGGCSMMPDMSEFRLPNRNTFLPSSTAAYVGPVSQSGAVGPNDLVDPQGACGPGGPPAQGSPEASTTASVPRGVGLEMPECDIVRALGQPSSVDIGSESGMRMVALTYRTGDRPGIYRFYAGRLKSIEQGPDAPAPAPTAKKTPPAKKPKTQQGA